MRFATGGIGAVGLLGLCVLAACGGVDAGPAGTASLAIKGGVADAADSNIVGIARAIGGGNGGFDECSGSLLAPNLVLTAHHCVADVTGEQNGFIDCALTSFASAAAPEDFFVTTQMSFTDRAADYRGVVDVVVPADSAGAGFCGLDVALLVLDDNVSASEATPLVPRLTSSIATGDVYDAVGFGNTGSGSGHADDAGERRRKDHLTVSCGVDDCDDDSHLGVGSEWVGEGDTCEGDSGGPALDDQGRVVGVLSRAGDGCASSIYGDVAAWSTLVKRAAQNAADAGGYDAPSWAGGPAALGCNADEVMPQAPLAPAVAALAVAVVVFMRRRR